jgi:hypothetical protein
MVGKMKNGHKRWPAIALLACIGIFACGEAKRTIPATTQSDGSTIGEARDASATPGGNAGRRAPLQSVDGDEEAVDVSKVLPGGRYDEDDTPLLRFGHSANAVDRRAVTSVVDRYNAAMAANDGARGCTLLYSLVREGMIEDFHSPLGRLKKSCTNVLRWLFRDTHRRHAFDARKVRVVQVQVRGNEALALMGAHNRIEHDLAARRERDKWKIAEINGGLLP